MSAGCKHDPARFDGLTGEYCDLRYVDLDEVRDSATPGEVPSLHYREVGDCLESGSNWENNPWFIPDRASGSDYSGALETRSNYRVLLSMCEELEDAMTDNACRPWAINLYGAHGTFALALHVERTPDEIVEALAQIEDYITLDEDDLFELEREAEDEAWEGWAERDYRAALEVAFAENAPFDAEVDADGIEDGELRDHFDQWGDETGTYWETQHQTRYIDVNVIAAAAAEAGARPDGLSITQVDDEDEDEEYEDDVVVARSVPFQTETLTDDERLLVDWMMQQRWYATPDEAVDHVLRMRRAGVNGLGDLGMRLVHLPVNASWVFIFGKTLETAQPINMGDHPMFFQSREDAVAAAHAQGLQVEADGRVRPFHAGALNGLSEVLGELGAGGETRLQAGEVVVAATVQVEHTEDVVDFALAANADVEVQQKGRPSGRGPISVVMAAFPSEGRALGYRGLIADFPGIIDLVVVRHVHGRYEFWVDGRWMDAPPPPPPPPPSRHSLNGLGVGAHREREREAHEAAIDGGAPTVGRVVEIEGLGPAIDFGDGSDDGLEGIVEDRRELRRQIAERRREVIPRLREAVQQARSRRALRAQACQLEGEMERAASKAEQRSCKAAARDEVQEALDELQLERARIQDMIDRAKTMVSKRGRAGGRRSQELRRESDDMVRNDLGDDQELLALFDKVKRRIKASKRRTRTEAFFEYVQDNPQALDELRAEQEAQWAREAEELFNRVSADEWTEQDVDDAWAAVAGLPRSRGRAA